MKRKSVLVLLCAVSIVCGGCRSTRASQDEAIRQAVIQYLSSLQMLNMNAMDVNLKKTTVSGDHATAEVEVRAKAAEAQGPGMMFEYSLEKRGAEWVVVKSNAGDGAMNHGATSSGKLPPGHPPMGDGAKSPDGHSNFSDLVDSAPNPPPATAGRP